MTGVRRHLSARSAAPWQTSSIWHLTSVLLIIVAAALAKALASATTSDLRLEAATLARLQVEGMLLSVCDYALAGYLPLETANCAFDAFVIVYLYSSHSKNLHLLTSD
jgi:hypothetical protein